MHHAKSGSCLRYPSGSSKVTASGGRALSARGDSRGVNSLKAASEPMLVGVSLSPRRPPSAGRSQSPSCSQQGQQLPAATNSTFSSSSHAQSLHAGPNPDIAMPAGTFGSNVGTNPMANTLHEGHLGGVANLSTFSTQQMKRLFKAMGPSPPSSTTQGKAPLSGDPASERILQRISSGRSGSSLHFPTFGTLQSPHNYSSSTQRQSDIAPGEIFITIISHES